MEWRLSKTKFSKFLGNAAEMLHFFFELISQLCYIISVNLKRQGEYYRYMPVGAFDSANWTSNKSKAYWFETYDEADEVANAV